MHNRIAISMGDYNGIGPEVILKSLSEINLSKSTPVILGDTSVFEFYCSLTGISFNAIHLAKSLYDIKDGKVNLLQCVRENEAGVNPGKLSEQAGLASMQAVEKGIELCMQNEVRALVTAPVSKEAVNRAGYHIPGHTEFLAQKTGVKNYLMTLVHDTLRVGLVTTHIPVSKIAGQIQTITVLSSIQTMHALLKHDFNIDQPEIAVLGLNPHAGDGGIIGDEETEQIIPAIKQANTEQIKADGPFPADGFFGSRKYEQFDGILAMYHDQGLAPFKALSFGGAVNVTGGLPMVRTSPDHGTAFDIAGKNLADSVSFSAAYRLAAALVKNRQLKAKKV